LYSEMAGIGLGKSGSKALGVAGQAQKDHKLQKEIRKGADTQPSRSGLHALARRIASVAERPGRVIWRVTSPELLAKEFCKSLTVISTNLWHDWPQRRRALARLEAFAQLAQEHRADVLLLQEVARTSSFWTDQWLADRLHMGYVYSRANGHVGGIGFEEGLAILSRYRIDGAALRQLNPASSRFVHRMALGARIASPCGELMAYSVHLGLVGKANARQAAHLSRWVGEHSGENTALVGGDFNAGEGTPQIQRLQQRWLDTFRHLHPSADGTTHEIRWPGGRSLHRARLDYIFLKAMESRWHVLEARHLQTPGAPHSDHRAVLLRLAPTMA
jgi:endonuclease/exonuclease/phosphatase family metal-dependent hydrolase